VSLFDDAVFGDLGRSSERKPDEKKRKAIPDVDMAFKDVVRKRDLCFTQKASATLSPIFLASEMLGCNPSGA